MIKAFPVHMKSDGFGPLVYRTRGGKDIHFYQYYGIMQSMGDEYHNLHLVVREEIKKGDCGIQFNDIGTEPVEVFYWEHDSSPAPESVCHKIIATTDTELHKKHGIPLISDEIVKHYAYAHCHDKVEDIPLETENVYVEPEGIHSNRGYFKDVLKLNEDGEVTMYHEPVQVVDWNQFSLEDLIKHLEDKFMFDSSGTAKAVHELIRAYRSKEKTEQELEKIFDESAKKHMIEWNLNSFKHSHRKLFRSIIDALKNVGNGRD
jgi:hypothetical protein